MDSVISIEAARTLVADAALWPRVRDFLWDFALQVHSSWMDDVNGISGLPGISGSSRTKAYVLSSLGVEPCFHDFPKDDWSRLALLDGETLLGIAKWLGALVCTESMRRVTDGATVRALKAALPGVYPEVFSYTAYFQRFDLAAKNVKDAKQPDEVLSMGFELLSSLLDACPASLVKRFKLKFPKKLCDFCVPSGEKKEQFSAGDAVKKLLKLKFPEAYSLCC